MKYRYKNLDQAFQCKLNDQPYTPSSSKSSSTGHGGSRNGRGFHGRGRGR